MAADFLRADGGDLILAVRLTPRAAGDAIGGVWRDEKDRGWLQISVRAVPEKGRANAALIQLIAKRFGLPAKDVVLDSGQGSRLKRIRLACRADEIDRIMKEMDIS